jgi:hypothetical protein
MPPYCNGFYYIKLHEPVKTTDLQTSDLQTYVVQNLNRTSVRFYFIFVLITL